MKFRRITLKVFITGLTVIALSQLLNFTFFSQVVKYDIAHALRNYADERVISYRQVIEKQLDEAYPFDQADFVAINGNLLDLSRVIPPSLIWITDHNNRVLFKSFDGLPPQIDDKDLARYPESEWIIKHRIFDAPYARYTIRLPHQPPGHLHFAFMDSSKSLRYAQRQVFMIILRYSFYGIFFGLTLSLIPFRLWFGKPLIALDDTVTQLTYGNLKARCEIKGDDEIWNIARSFNYMADTIESMIASTKELTANISHEIRSPLARIHMTEAILRKRLENEPNAQDYLPLLDMIQEEVEETNDLVGRILHLSKLEMHRLSDRREKINLSAMLREIVARFATTFESKRIEVKLNLPPQDAWLMADAIDLHSAISNLCDNAAKYTPEFGNITLSLSVESNQLSFKIANTCQIDPYTDLNKFFEPFYRQPGVPQTGTGLGLTITSKIIRNHGANLTASRTVDGICFEIRCLGTLKA